MDQFVLVLSGVGAFVFGIVVGWITYRTLRRSESGGISDIATVIGAVGGAAVTALFPQETGAFGAYCIGLGIGFFVYLGVALLLAKSIGKPETVADWLGSAPARNRGMGGAVPGPGDSGVPPLPPRS
jgi:hypothetical protein